MLTKIQPAALALHPFDLLDSTWALLVAGTDKPNPMTVSWGGMGTLWNRPVVTVYVRPTRYTWQLLNGHPEFTLNFMPDSFRKALNICGRYSGADTDKWAKANLTAEASESVAVPRVQGAMLAIECRTLAFQDFDPGRFLRPEIEENYPRKDYHRIFWGEALAVWIDQEMAEHL